MPLAGPPRTPALKIHPTAVVSPAAVLADDVEVGPFCIIEAGAQIAAGCRLVAHVTVRSGTSIGTDTTVYEGAVIGGMPQHINPPSELGGVLIGSGNVIREHATIHRAMYDGQLTTIGNNCLLMVGSHVAHDCRVGNHVIMTNGAMLGGHVQIGDRACLGGNSAVHQFCRIGRLSMIGGCTKVTQDLPPFVLTDGSTAMIVGLNRVGLRRSGLSREEVLSLKAAYRLIYREGLNFNETLSALQQRFPTGVASEFADFFSVGERGFVQERRSPPRVALRIHPAVDYIEEDSRPATYRRAAG